MDQIFTYHKFTLTKNGQTLSDALILPVAEYAALNTTQITALKNQRFDEWKYTIDHPVVVSEPSLDVKIAAVTQQITDLQIQKTDLLDQKSKGGK